MLGVRVDIALFPGTLWFILSTGHAKWSLHHIFSACCGPQLELTAQGKREALKSVRGWDKEQEACTGLSQGKVI